MNKTYLAWEFIVSSIPINNSVQVTVIANDESEAREKVSMIQNSGNIQLTRITECFSRHIAEDEFRAEWLKAFREGLSMLANTMIEAKTKEN